MRNTINWLIFGIIIAVSVFSNSVAAQSYNYYLLAYADNNELGTGILFEKIDLDSKSIVLNQVLDLSGELQFYNPIPLITGARHDTTFFITTFFGLVGKNTRLSDHVESKYVLVSNAGIPLKFGQIPSIQLLDYKYIDSGLEFNYKDEDRVNVWGRVVIVSTSNISIQYLRNENFDTISYPQISKFRGFSKLSSTNDNLYWDATPDGEYLIKMNVNRRSLQDSVRLTYDGHYNCVVGLAPGDSLIYTLKVYNHISAEPESLARITSNQGYAKIMRASDFVFLDSIPIEDPPIEAGYIGGGMGPCDRVGPYLVNYFSNSQDYRQFFPAMLFIFDTRTNRATWLRVGWR